MMYYNGMMSGFGLAFVLIYLAAVVYFFYLLTGIAKSLRRIADRLDELPSLGGEREKNPS